MLNNLRFSEISLELQSNLSLFGSVICTPYGETTRLVEKWKVTINKYID